MKKLMMIFGALLIAGGISAHPHPVRSAAYMTVGFIAPPVPVFYAPRVVIAQPAPRHYYRQEYRNDRREFRERCGCHEEYYRGGDHRGRR